MRKKTVLHDGAYSPAESLIIVPITQRQCDTCWGCSDSFLHRKHKWGQMRVWKESRCSCLSVCFLIGWQNEMPETNAPKISQSYVAYLCLLFLKQCPFFSCRNPRSGKCFRKEVQLWNFSKQRFRCVAPNKGEVPSNLILESLRNWLRDNLLHQTWT